MKISKKEASWMSFGFMTFMTLILMSALTYKKVLDVLYIFLIIFYISRIIYINLAYGDEEEDKSHLD